LGALHSDADWAAWLGGDAHVVLPCRRTTPSWPLLRPAAAAAAAATITTAASAIADADSALDFASATATCHHPRHATAGRWPPPLIPGDAASSIFTDALAASSTAAATANRPLHLYKVGDGATRSIRTPHLPALSPALA